MAYKKYVKRDGKTFGPYYYESYRDSSGKVCKKYVGTTDPKEKDVSGMGVSKKTFLTFIIALIGIFGLMFLLTNSSLISNVILGEESIEESFVIKSSSLEIKAPSALARNVAAKNKNKRMDFDIGGDNLRLYFDLLNYSEFVGEVEKAIESETSLITGLAVRADKNVSLKKVREKVRDLDLGELEKIKDRSVVEAEDFDIEIMVSEDVDYKWGYEVELNSLNFMAKVDVTSDEGILILSDNSLKIGDSILSFADLEAEGYSVRIERPALEIVEEVVIIVNETLKVVNETVEPVNETVETVNETVEPVNETVEIVNETVEPVNETEEVVNETIEPVNETVEEEVNETIIEEEVVEEVPVEEVVEEVVPEEEVVEEIVEEVVEEVVEEEVAPEEPVDIGITGNLIRGLVGFVVSGADDLEYENSITVYIERDFNGTEYEVGDIIMLDPTLNIIEITKAEHLDSNRIFVSDIYDDVKSLDEVWSEVVGDGEYVRVTFEVPLNASRDITVYARGDASLEVYEKDGVEVVADFGNVVDGRNKVFLTGLIGMQDVFDLKVVGGSLEFDWIVDPMPVLSIVYPQNNSVTSYASYPTEINYISNADGVWCWYDAGYGNSTAVSCGTNFTNVQYNSPSYGDITWTVYGNDSAGNVGSTSVTFAKDNSLPVANSVSTAVSVLSNKDITCSFDVTDSDYVIKLGTGGVDGSAPRPNSQSMWSIFCDDTYCYGGHLSGYFTKTYKNGTIAIGTAGTESAAVRVVIADTNGLSCDDTYCYGAHDNGYFTKIYKNGTIAIGTSGTESEAIIPDINNMLAISCDDTYCYGAHDNGYFTKIYKNGTIVRGTGGTEGGAIRPDTNGMYAISCDDTYCYAGHHNGYFTKTHKNGTIVIGTSGTESEVVQSYTARMTAISCDDTYCYGGHSAGYFTKTHKNGTIIIGSGGIEGDAVRPYTNGMYAISCDDTYCYGAHALGYFTKIHKNGTIAIGTAGTESETIKVDATWMYAISCDDTYCYGGQSSGYFTKVEKGSGDFSFDANLTWYKNGVSNLTSIFTGVVHGSTINTLLDAGNTSKDENWSCEITPYDGTVYGVAASSSNTSVLNVVPTIDWSKINAPLYDSLAPEAEALYIDADLDDGTLYFEWFVNSVSVENDTVSGVANGTKVKAYLNSGVFAGDIVNVTVFAGDGTDNTSLSFLQHIILGVGGEAESVPSSTEAKGVFCDDTYCYGAHLNGRFTKTYKNGTIAIGNGGTESEQVTPSLNHMYAISCDDTYCYGGHALGRFTKTYKNGTIVIGIGGTESTEIAPYSLSMFGITCDDTYCYGAHQNGYFTKTYKNGTIVIGNGGTESEAVRTDTNDMTGISCDDTYCYGSHQNGYFTKTYKNGTIAIGTSGTESEVVRPYTTTMYAISCDDTYCYGAYNAGYFTKTYKNGTIAIGTSGTESEVVRPYTQRMYAISCDDTYCYGGHNIGYFTKTYKNGTIAIGTSGTESAIIRLSSTAIWSISCDNTYCYGAGGFFSKALKSLDIKVIAAPSITSLDSPANDSFETTDIVFGFTPTFGSSLSSCDLWGDWNGGWHLNQTLGSVNVDANNNFNAMNIGDGNYEWNVQCTGDSLLGSFNSVNYTVTVDTVAPVVVRYDEGMPAADSVGGESVYYNWSVTDNQDDNLTCYTMMDSVQMGTYYVANASLNGATEALDGGPHSLFVRCYDDANNYADSNSLVYLVAVIDIVSPSVDGDIYRIGDVTSFAVNEISGADFLDRVSISIMNSMDELAQFYLNVAGTNHTGNYVWAGEPAHVMINAWGFNAATGESQNATDSVSGVFLRAAGTTAVPILESACPDETYVTNGTTIDINLHADLDTLILSESVIITDPDNVSYELAYDSSSVDNDYYFSFYNYSFVANKSGYYGISASVTDYENQTSNWSYDVSASGSSYNTYKINSSTFQHMSWDRKCTGVETTSGSELTFILTDEALVDLETKTVDVLHNITLMFNDVNLTGDMLEAVSYREMSDEITPPSGKRRVALFELNSTMNFSNYTFIYDYNPIAHTFTDESALKLYKCDNVSSCVLVEIASVLNMSANRLTATNLVNFSYFMITEDEVAGETVIETVTTSGGSNTETVYRSLNIITPGDIELGLADQVVVPVTLNNPESIDLNKITLRANSTTIDIDPIFEESDISVLGAGENETVMLFLESHSLPGEYEVHIQVEVESPSFVETAIIFVRLVESPGLSVIVERIVLAQDLFRENPQCLELNDLLIEAQRLIDSGETENARVIVQETIYKCKELVTAREFPLNLSTVKEWRTPVMVSLGLIILALIIAVIIRKPKLDLYKSRKKKKKWFGFGKKRRK